MDNKIWSCAGFFNDKDGSIMVTVCSVLAVDMKSAIDTALVKFKKDYPYGTKHQALAQEVPDEWIEPTWVTLGRKELG